MTFVLLPPRLAQTVIVVVTVFWAVNQGLTVASSFLPGFSFHADAALNGIFMGTVGAVFVVSRKRRPGQHDPDPDPDGDGGEPPDAPGPAGLPQELLDAVDPAQRYLNRRRDTRPPPQPRSGPRHHQGGPR